MADPLATIALGRSICGDLEQAERREWWLSNGLGGYAAGTLAGSLTRRYHGLLIAPPGQSLGRHLIFSKADATLVLDKQEWPLFTNRWADGSTSPAGHVNLESFKLEGRMPVWHFAFGDISLEMRIWMEQGRHRTYVAYRLHGSRPASLNIDLLVNARDHHGNMEAGGFSPDITLDNGRLKVVNPELFRLYLQGIGGTLTPQSNWYTGFTLVREQERGLSDRDNNLCVGSARLELAPGEWSGLAAGLDEPEEIDLEAAMARFQQRDRQLVCAAESTSPEFQNAPGWIGQLLQTADSFLFSRPLPQIPEGESIIAGYPWFGDWGRDTMIALPGLTLACGRYDTARRILKTFARLIDRGMLPNRFVDAGEQPEYNTVDAALWFIEAWRAYFDASDDHTSLPEMFPVLQDMIDWHIRGTRYGIRMDPSDKLLHAGEAGVQLTWMDAKVGSWVVTPRIGKPVEVNALWYNALCILASFAKTLGEDSHIYTKLADQVKASFKRYLRGDGGLYDVLDGSDGNDSSVRPNQIFAVSLPHSPLDMGAQKRVVAECGGELLTSYGLRSLGPADPQYRSHYSGGVYERDGAYHQGTVWGWLLGHYALAEYRVHGDAELAQRRLEPLMSHLADAGLGTISEIFDADPPHLPRGAPSQAWSVACTLESWWRLESAKENN